MFKFIRKILAVNHMYKIINDSQEYLDWQEIKTIINKIEGNN
jgi:hypothetical protein